MTCCRLGVLVLTFVAVAPPSSGFAPRLHGRPVPLGVPSSAVPLRRAGLATLRLASQTQQTNEVSMSSAKDDTVGGEEGGEEAQRSVAPSVSSPSGPQTTEVSGLDEWLINMGVKQDPRVPEEQREDTMSKIKKAGKAGVVSYALTEGAFWLLSVPLAVAGVAATTGSLPDLSTAEGQAKTAAYSFAFLTFARTVVPLRIALALALTPWVDTNIMSRFKKDD